MPKIYKILQCFFEFTTKNTKILFVYNLCRKRIPLFDNSNK